MLKPRVGLAGLVVLCPIIVSAQEVPNCEVCRALWGQSRAQVRTFTLLGIHVPHAAN